MLVWFQKADTLQLRNNSFRNFDCSELLPAPAAYKELRLTGNGLTSVPACTLRRSVNYLDLSHNAISNISLLQFPTFVPMPDLNVLDLSNNKITDVGILSYMQNLSFLWLNGNRIFSLNKLAFSRLPDLAFLDLSRNDIHEIEPGTFKTHLDLRELHLSHNKLRTFDNSLTPIRRYFPDVAKDLSTYQSTHYVCMIFLDHNEFSHPPFAANDYQPSVDMVVHAADNPYACDCQMTQFVLTANQTSKGYVPYGKFENRTSLNCQFPLYLRGVPLDQVAFNDTCPLVLDCPENCSCLFSTSQPAVHVDCTKSEASSLPLKLPGSYPLHVNFTASDSNSSLGFFSLEDTEYLQRLVSLDVSGRGLAQVPTFMCEALVMAEELDLSHNNLKRLPECLHTRPSD
jgi:Leucine-rich repeat (LRR) protein